MEARRGKRTAVLAAAAAVVLVLLAFSPWAARWLVGRQVGGGLRSAPAAAARSDLGDLAAALEDWAVDHGGTFPLRLEELVELRDGERAVVDAELPRVDPWGAPYHYERSSDRRGFRVWTLGADGEPGGAGNDADLEIGADGRVVESWTR